MDELARNRLTGGALAHQSEELIRSGLSRHSPQYLPERVGGKPLILGKKLDQCNVKRQTNGYAFFSAIDTKL